MDSDEEEMREMRASVRHSGRTGPEPRNPSPPVLAEANVQPRHESSPFSVAEARELGEGELGELGEVGSVFGFMSFGRQTKAQKLTAHEHVQNQRRGREAPRRGIALGSTSSKEAARLIQEGPKVEAKQESLGPLLVDMEMSHGREPDQDVEAPPCPGTESEVLPMSHEVLIKGHKKSVSTLAFDTKASRMATGGIDGQVRLYDFNGMSETKEAFRNFEPAEGYLIQSLAWSSTGGLILSCTSDAHLRIYDRDGSSKPVQTTVKGDMYVRSMENTKGHTQTVTDGRWHPLLNERWISSSLDGTIRIWDLTASPVGMEQVLPCIQVLKCLDKRNVCIGGGSGKTGGLYPTCCTISSDAKRIVGGCSDGSVQIFNEKPRYLKPDKILREAHSAPLTRIEFIGGTGSHLMATRSLDGTMKVWDCRSLSDAKGPLKVFANLPCAQEKTGMASSPDGRYLVTGTSFRGSADQSASVVLYDTKTFKLLRTLDFGSQSVLGIAWPSEINQIAVGTTTGDVVMLYSPYSSKKGALHFVGKRAKVKPQESYEYEGPIFNMTDPDEIRKFWNTGHGNMTRIRRIEARENQKTLKPEKPPTIDGSINEAARNTAALVHHVCAKHGATKRKSNQTEDIQKRLLGNSEADKDPQFVDQAYKGNKKILDWSVEEESEGDRRMQEMRKGDFCRKCGMKLCRCTDYSDWSKMGNKKPKL